MIKSQEPKYDCVGGKLVNRATRDAIPDGEPVFILRAKDTCAILALQHYRELCANGDHRNIVLSRIKEFEQFRMDNPEKMGEPDTVLKVNYEETGFEDSETSL